MMIKNIFTIIAISTLSATALNAAQKPSGSPVVGFPEYIRHNVHPGASTSTITKEAQEEAKNHSCALDYAGNILRRFGTAKNIIESITIKDLLALQKHCTAYQPLSRAMSLIPQGIRTTRTFNLYVKDLPASKHISSIPKFIKTELNQFLASLQKRINDSQNPLTIASYAHMELLRIYPFNWGNGRVARILFNIIMMAFGNQPIDFPESDPYLKAVLRTLNPTANAKREEVEANKSAFKKYCLDQLERVKRTYTSASQLTTAIDELD